MSDVINCIERYIEIIDNEKFIKHWKDLSIKLIKGIQDSYNHREENIVRTIESIINSIGKFSTRRDDFHISTTSIFIHGNRSQVEFEYYEEKKQRELGDIIFILSVVYNGKKYFEKMTITQVKKSKTTSWSFYRNSAKEQLYLLSRFPTFRGVRNSLIPAKDYNLSNNSGCLGTHGLLYFPGDFALISSKELEAILSAKKRATITLNDLVKRIPFNITCCIPYCLLCESSICLEECFSILDKLYRIYYRYLDFPYFVTFPLFVCNLPILRTCCISHNVYDFSHKYLIGHIGELIYAENLPYNKNAFQFLQDLFGIIKRKAERESLEIVLNFIESFYQYRYNSENGYNSDKLNRDYNENNYEEGGIGIIYTIVNLGEGKY